MAENTKAKENEAMLMMFASDIVRSAQRNGNSKAMLTEEIIEEIVRVSEANTDLNDPEKFEEIKKKLERMITQEP